MLKQSYFKQFSFCISTLFSSIWPIDGTLSGATTSTQRGPGSDVNEGLLCIPQSSSITGTSTLDYLVSILGHPLWGSAVLPLCREAVVVFYSPSQVGNIEPGLTWPRGDHMLDKFVSSRITKNLQGAAFVHVSHFYRTH